MSLERRPRDSATLLAASVGERNDDDEKTTHQNFPLRRRAIVSLVSRVSA